MWKCLRDLVGRIDARYLSLRGAGSVVLGTDGPREGALTGLLLVPREA
jgi:hypothetical protein